MLRKRSFWTGVTIVTLLPLAIAAAPRLGAGERADDAAERYRQAHELIAKGQADLGKATTIATRHVRGPSLEATVLIESNPTEPEAARLVYTVTCYAEGKVWQVKVDGRELKVIDAKPVDQPKPPGA